MLGYVKTDFIAWCFTFMKKVKIISAKNIPEYEKMSDIMFIDLRTREEFEMGHIGKAFCLSLEQIEDNDYCLASDYRYILYCNRGGASMHAAALMADGDAEVYTLAGGMDEYEIFLRSLVDRKRTKL